MGALFVLLAIGAAPPAAEQRYPIDVFVRDWRSCGVVAEAGGVTLQCGVALSVTVQDVALKATPSVLEEGLKSITGKRTPATVATKAGPVQATRITFKGAAGESFALGVVVPTTAHRSRRIVCLGTVTPTIGRVCEEVIGAFSAVNGVKQFLTRPRDPWGPPNADPALERRAVFLIEATVPKEWKGVMAPEVVVGPALGAWLTEQDPKFEAIGAKAGFDGLQGPVTVRTFDGPKLDAFLASRGIDALLRRIARGTARAATAEERKAFYGRVPFELGPLVAIVPASGPQVLVLHFEGEQVDWLDLL